MISHHQHFLATWSRSCLWIAALSILLTALEIVGWPWRGTDDGIRYQLMMALGSIIGWAAFGVLARVPQGDPDRLKASTLFAIRVSLMQCASRYRYDGDSWAERGNDVRRNASWQCADMADSALKMLEHDYEV